MWCRVEGRSRTDLKASSSVSSLSMREVRVVMVLRDGEKEEQGGEGKGEEGRGKGRKVEEGEKQSCYCCLRSRMELHP